MVGALIDACCTVSGVAGLERVAAMGPSVTVAIASAAIGFPSLGIAFGLLGRRRWAACLALAGDLLVVIAVVIGILGGLTAFAVTGGYVMKIIWRSAIAAFAGLLFGAEASHLLSTVWGWLRARYLFSLLAAGLVLMVAVGPVAVNIRLLRHVRPLMAYVEAHWVRFPQDSRMSVELWSSVPEGHRDRIHVQTEHGEWFMVVQHGPSGRWHLPAGQRGDGVLKGERRQRSPDIRSVGDARALLRESGVVDRDLGLGRTITGLGSDVYEFWSPRARGFYYVHGPGDIELCLKDSLEVP